MRKILSPDLFPKLDAKRPVRAAMALDRDYRREPRAPRAVEVAPHLTAVEAVWSRNCIESLFLVEPETLAAWLAPYVSTDAAALRGLVARAIEEADRDRSLEDAAYEGRYPFHRRPDKSDRMLSEKAANKATREEIGKDPSVWQPGKKRASFILTRVRDALPKADKRNVRGSLADIITGAATKAAADPTVLVPAEIRSFLDLLVA